MLKKYITNELTKEEIQYKDIPFYVAKNEYLSIMKKIYRQLDKNIINWIITLEKEHIFDYLFKTKKINLSIETQKEYTIKNYEKHSKIYLPIANKILSPYPTTQIQINEKLEEKIFEGYISVLEIDWIWTLSLHQKWIDHIATLLSYAVKCHDNTLDICSVIEIYELILSPLVTLSCCHIINCAESKVLEHAVARCHITVCIESLEKHNLVLRKIHIGSHLLVKAVQ